MSTSNNTNIKKPGRDPDWDNVNDLREEFIKEARSYSRDLPTLARKFEETTGKSLHLVDPIMVDTLEGFKEMISHFENIKTFAVDTEVGRAGKVGTTQVIPIMTNGVSDGVYTIVLRAFDNKAVTSDGTNQSAYIRTELSRIFNKEDSHQYYYNLPWDVGRLADSGFNLALTNSKGEVTAHDVLSLSRRMGKVGIDSDKGKANSLVEVVKRKLNAFSPKDLSGVDFGPGIGKFDYMTEVEKSLGADMHLWFKRYGASDVVSLAKLVEAMYTDNRADFAKPGFSVTGKLTSDQIKKLEEIDTKEYLRNIINSTPPGIHTLLAGENMRTSRTYEKNGTTYVSSYIVEGKDDNPVMKMLSPSVIQAERDQYRKKELESYGNNKIDDAMRAHAYREAERKHMIDKTKELRKLGVNMWSENDAAITGNSLFNPVAGLRTVPNYVARSIAYDMGLLSNARTKSGKLTPKSPGTFYESAELFYRTHNPIASVYNQILKSYVGGDINAKNVDKALATAYQKIKKVPAIGDVVLGLDKYGVSEEAIRMDPERWTRYYHKHLIDNWMGLSAISKTFPRSNKEGTLSSLREVVLSSLGPFKHTKSAVQGFTRGQSYAARDDALRSGQAREILVDMALPEIYDMVPGIDRFRMKKGSSLLKYAVDIKESSEIMNQKNVLGQFKDKYYGPEQILGYQRLGKFDNDPEAIKSRLLNLGYDDESITQAMAGNENFNLSEMLTSPVIYNKDENLPWTEVARIPVTGEVKSYAESMMERRGGYSKQVQDMLDRTITYDSHGNVKLGEADPRTIGGSRKIPLTTGWYIGTLTKDIAGLVSPHTFRDVEFLKNIPKFTPDVYDEGPEGMINYLEDSYRFFSQPDIFKSIPGTRVGLQAAKSIKDAVLMEMSGRTDSELLKTSRDRGYQSEFALSDAKIMKLNSVLSNVANKRIVPQARHRRTVLDNITDRLNTVKGEVNEMNVPLRGASHKEIKGVVQGYARDLDAVGEIFGSPFSAGQYSGFVDSIVEKKGVEQYSDQFMLKRIREFVKERGLDKPGAYSTSQNAMMSQRDVRRMMLAKDLAGGRQASEIYMKHFAPEIYNAIGSQLNNTRGEKPFLKFNIMQNMEGGKRSPITTSPFETNDMEFVNKLISMGVVPFGHNPDRVYKVGTDEVSRILGKSIMMGGAEYYDKEGKIHKADMVPFRLESTVQGKVSSIFFNEFADILQRQGTAAADLEKAERINRSRIEQEALDKAQSVQITRDKAFASVEGVRKIEYRHPEGVDSIGAGVTFIGEKQQDSLGTHNKLLGGAKRNLEQYYQKKTTSPVPRAEKMIVERPLGSKPLYDRYKEEDINKIPLPELETVYRKEKEYIPEDYYVKYVEDIKDIIGRTSHFAEFATRIPEPGKDSGYGIVSRYLKSFGPFGTHTEETGQDIFGLSYSKFTNIEGEGQRYQTVGKESEDIRIKAILKSIEGRKDATELLSSMDQSTRGYRRSTQDVGFPVKKGSPSPEEIKEVNLGGSIYDWLSRADITKDIHGIFGRESYEQVINPVTGEVEVREKNYPAIAKSLANMRSSVIAKTSSGVSSADAITQVISQYREQASNIAVPFENIKRAIEEFAESSKEVSQYKRAGASYKELSSRLEGNSIYDYLDEGMSTDEIMDQVGDSNAVASILQIRNMMNSGMSRYDAINAFKKSDMAAFSGTEKIISGYSSEELAQSSMEPIPAELKVRPNVLGEMSRVINDYIGYKNTGKIMAGVGLPRGKIRNSMMAALHKVKKFGSGTPDIAGTHITGSGKIMGGAIVGEAGPEISIDDKGTVRRHNKGAELVYFNSPTSVIPDGKIKGFAKGTKENPFVKVLEELNLSDLEKRGSIAADLIAQGATAAGPSQEILDTIRSVTDTLDTFGPTPETAVQGHPIARRLFGRHTARKLTQHPSRLGLYMGEDLSTMSRMQEDLINSGISGRDIDPSGMQDPTAAAGPLELHKQYGEEIYGRTKRQTDIYDITKTAPARRVNPRVGNYYADEIERLMGGFESSTSGIRGVGTQVGVSHDTQIRGLEEVVKDMTNNLAVLGAAPNRISAITDRFGQGGTFGDNINSPDVDAVNAAFNKLTASIGILNPELNAMSTSVKIQNNVRSRMSSPDYERELAKQGYVGNVVGRGWQNLTSYAGVYKNPRISAKPQGGETEEEATRRANLESATESRRRGIVRAEKMEGVSRFLKGRPDKDIKETAEVSFSAAFGMGAEGKTLKTSVMKGMEDFVMNTFSPIVGENKARGFLKMQSGAVFDATNYQNKSQAVQEQVSMRMVIPADVLSQANIHSNEDLSRILQSTVLNKNVMSTAAPGTVDRQQFSIAEGQISAKTSAENSAMLSTAATIQGHGRRLTALSMGAMGTYFSVTGIYGAITQGIRMVTDSLKDLSSSMKSIALTDAFSNGLLKSKDIMDQIGVNQDDFVKGWQNLTSLQSAVQVFLGSIAAKIFKIGEEDNFGKIAKSLTDAFKKVDVNSLVKSMQDLLIAGTQLLPTVMGLVTWIGGFLANLAKSPFAPWIVGFTVLAFILQPMLTIIATLIEAFATLLVVGGYMGPMFGLAAKGTVALGTGAAFAGNSIWALNGALMTSLAIVAAGIIAWQVLGSVINAITGWNIPTPLSLASDVLSFVGSPHVAGGMVDDTIISAQTGEYVVNRTSTMANLPLIMKINDAKGKLKENFAGGLIGYQTGGLIGGGLLPSASPAMESASTSINRGMLGDLTEVTSDGSLASKETSKVLSDASGGKYINVKMYDSSGMEVIGKGNEPAGFGGFPDIFGGIGELLQNAFTPIVSTPPLDIIGAGVVGAKVGSMMPEFDIGKVISDAWTAFKTALGELWAGLKEKLGKIWANLGLPSLGEIWGGFKSALLHIWDKLGLPELGPIWEKVTTKLTELKTNFLNGIEDAWRKSLGLEPIDRTTPPAGSKGTTEEGLAERTKPPGTPDNAVEETKKEIKARERAAAEEKAARERGVTGEKGGKGWRGAFTLPNAMAFGTGAAAMIPTTFLTEEGNVNKEAMANPIGSAVKLGTAGVASVVIMKAFDAIASKAGTVAGAVTKMLPASTAAEVTASKVAGTAVASKGLGALGAYLGHDFFVDTGSRTSKFVAGSLGGGENNQLAGQAGRYAGGLLGDLTGGGWGIVGGMIADTIGSNPLGLTNNTYGGFLGSARDFGQGKTSRIEGNKFGIFGDVGAEAMNWGFGAGQWARRGITGSNSGDVGKVVGGAIASVPGTVYGDVAGSLGAVYGAGQQFGGAARGAVQGYMQDMTKATGGAGANAGEQVKASVNASVEAFNSAMTGLNANVKTSGDSIMMAFAGTTANVINGGIDMAAGFSGISSTITGALNGGLAGLSGIGESIKNAIMGFVTGAGGGAVKAVAGIGEGILKGGGDILGALTGAADGGLMTKDGIINAHRGELIGPIERVSNVLNTGAQATRNQSQNVTSSTNQISISIPIQINGNADRSTVMNLKSELESLLPKMLRQYDVKKMGI